ncbi:DNA (cytosine-5-)-methyltransferase [Mucilaginibacter sp.]|uniref:DNA (cytosine-5-)-methyltransferase n=1 Tax=Mucilaginibacter sp. TaxID=1882438 RepID=UPI0025F3B667|nr:DNA (cytosine-5-)-methyltransferase [Mucilaginibacter sp.]
MAVKPSQAKSSIITDELDTAVLTHYVVTQNPVYKERAYEITESTYGNFSEPEVLYQAVQKNLFNVTDIPFPGPEPGTEKFTFIDLFAGIGGFRLALQNLGGLCLYSSEYDKYAQKTYLANFGETPFGDITKEETKSFIPQDFDILCGGFPCQPFSIAGVSKKNSLGRKHGFEDEKQGNLFFHVAEIIEKHRPKAFFLENVKNLVSHDKGNTFKVIKQTLLDLGYSFDHRVLNGKHFVPQHRDRTIMVGFDKSVFGEDISFDFNLVKLPDADKKIKTILKKDVDPKYTLTNNLWNYLQEYSKKHKLKGNGFGFGLVNMDGITRTISARYYKDGSEILIPQDGLNPRRLTPDECAALQGYPVNKGKKSFRIPVSDNQAYKQFGNSVVTPLIEAVGKEITNVITSFKD